MQKLKRDAIALDAECVDEFHKEGDLLRSLRSRNIVLFYGTGQFDDDENSAFVVLEYMARGSLRRNLDLVCVNVCISLFLASLS